MPGMLDVPGVVMLLPGVVPMPVLMLVGLFMLLGPVAADGEPAELCIPPPRGMAPMPEPPEVACDGLAFMVVAPGAEVEPPPEPPALAEPGPELAAPAPMVWAEAAVAASAKAPAINIVFTGYPPVEKRGGGDDAVLIERLTARFARRLRD
jgi:hypothetical protein